MWQQAKNVYHLPRAFLVSLLYGFPAQGMTVIGITGTDGKTTTASLLFHILKATGRNAALISTVGAVIGDEKYNTGFHVTTPGSLQIQSYIKRAKDAKVKYLVLEVTSHALDQHRVYGVPFAIGVITNISHEHLDYHKTYEKYVFAKSRLIQLSNIGVLNKDDSSYSLLLRILKGKKKIITYGMENADFTEQVIKPIKTNLLGEYNLYNLLAVTAVTAQFGITIEEVKNALQSFELPKGRTEVVYKNAFTVMIDFAHTPNAFEQLLSALKKEKKYRRIIHVFGAAGERDASKRPLMGEVAGRYDDYIILTAEDPRTEPVEKIINGISEGILRSKGSAEVRTALDRQEAIDLSVAIAGKDDIVVITGKGHEESMNFGNGEVAWSDHEAVKKALAKRYEK